MCHTDDIFLPCITFSATLPPSHTLFRQEFPLAPAYATTFNGRQGLTLDRIGLDLICPAFSHGQLYPPYPEYAIVPMPEYVSRLDKLPQQM